MGFDCRGGRLIVQARIVGVDCAHRATLSSELLCGNNWVFDKAYGALPALQLRVASERHESAVSKKRISLIDVKAFDGYRVAKPLGDGEICIERGKQSPSALQWYRRDLTHALKARQKNCALNAPCLGGILARHREVSGTALHYRTGWRRRSAQRSV